MKPIVILLILFLAVTSLPAQDGNPNTMSVMVDGKEFVTQPRRIKIGHYGYITGNSINPDKSLRFWLGSFDGLDMKESGSYLILGEDDRNKDEAINKEYMTGKYKGIAYVKWVEETKSPRMEYHVGESFFNGESLEAVFGEDGYLDITFNVTLEGSYWKEKGTATAFGGIGRIVDKMEDKAVTSATGYDQDIDPEGAGYKKQKVTDTIKLTGGKVRLRMEKM